MKDVLQELKEISCAYPYELHMIFSQDVEQQYSDFKQWREETTDVSTSMDNESSYMHIVENVQSSLGNSLSMFFAELEVF